MYQRPKPLKKIYFKGPKQPKPWYRDPSNVLESPVRQGWCQGHKKDRMADVSKFGRPDWCSLDLKAISEAQTGDHEPEGAGSNTVSPIVAPLMGARVGTARRGIQQVVIPMRVARKLKF